MKRFVPMRPYWALLSLVTALGWTPISRAAVQLGDIEIPNIGHTFQPPTPTGNDGTSKDWLIDQAQVSGAMARLMPFTTTVTPDDTFQLRISAPAGMKFWLHPAPGGWVNFLGGMHWQLTNLLPGSTATYYSSSVDIAFENLAGLTPTMNPNISYDAGHRIMAVYFSGFGLTELTFTSMTVSGKVPGAFELGSAPVQFVPTQDSWAYFTYYVPSDPGPFVTLIPAEQPVDAIVSLSEALDTVGTPFVWTTIGDYSTPKWLGRLFGARDGTDCAVSPEIANGKATTLQGKAIGPGTLDWWWKVSSETNRDFFKMFVDGVQQSRISGEVGWLERSVHLDAGLHVLKWTYAKDSGNAAGADKGWVDQVRFIPDTNCLFTLSANSRSHNAGAVIGTVDIVTSNGCPWSAVCTNTWIAILSPLANRGSGTVTYALAQNPTMQPRAGVLTIAGQPFAVTQSGGVTNTPAQSLIDAINSPEILRFSWQGQALTSQSLVTHDGVDAIQFGPIGHDGSVSLHLFMLGPGTLSFWWKVSCETNLDIFKFFGPEGEVRISGETDWQQRSYRISEGSPEVYWVYSKDESFSVGNDRGWLDQVVFTPDLPASVALTPTNRVHAFGTESGSVNVTLISPGTWRAGTTSEWIHVYSGPLSTNDGRVNYQLDLNTNGADRVGQIHIGDQTFTVLQSNGVCVASVSPTHAELGWQGLPGVAIFTVPAPGCPLAPTTTNNWISFVSNPTSGTSTRIDYLLQPNPNRFPRTGWVKSADAILEIVQAGNTNLPDPDVLGTNVVTEIERIVKPPMAGGAHGVVTNFLVRQPNWIGASLPPVFVSWDTRTQFIWKVVAPAGGRIVVQPSAGAEAVFEANWRWDWVGDGSDMRGPLSIQFEGVRGMLPAISGTSSLSSTHGFFGLSLASTPFTNTFSFTSMTLTGAVAKLITGVGGQWYVPRLESALMVRAESTQPNNINPLLVMVVPDDPILNLRILDFTRTNGAILQLQGPRYETNIVQVSSNLTQWSSISTNAMPAMDCPVCPTVLVLDRAATNWTRRFYRAVRK